MEHKPSPADAADPIERSWRRCATSPGSAWPGGSASWWGGRANLPRWTHGLVKDRRRARVWQSSLEGRRRFHTGVSVVPTKMVKRVLGRSYAVYDFPSVAEALPAVDRAPFDVIVTDLRMPGIDGLEGLRRFQERIPALPVVIVTAFATVETAVEAMKAGAFDYLKKPFEPEELELVVARAGEHARARPSRASSRPGSASSARPLRRATPTRPRSPSRLAYRGPRSSANNRSARDMGASITAVDRSNHSAVRHQALLGGGKAVDQRMEFRLADFAVDGQCGKCLGGSFQYVAGKFLPWLILDGSPRALQ